LYDRLTEKYYFDAEDVTYSFYINDEKKYAQLRLTDFSMGSDNRETAFENFLKNSFELLSHKKNIRHLIIDLRENTGGSLYNCFLLQSYLAKKAFAEYQNVFTKISRIPYENYLVGSGELYDTSDIKSTLKDEFLARAGSGYMVPDSLIEIWEPDKYKFEGSVYIITNATVTSAAAYFALLAKTNSAAKIIGVETAGGAFSGNGFKMLKYQLPFSNIRLRFPYARMQYTDDESAKGHGIIPDYTMPDTYASFDKNEDLQLNFIIDSILLKNR
jgi:C-terminal processing protease CtpA/Prc